MTGVEGLKAKLGLPPISQIGVIVKDVRKATEYYSSLFGIGPFTIYDFEPKNIVYMGEKVYCRSKMKAMWGNIELEVIQPMEGKSTSMDFLQMRVDVQWKWRYNRLV